MGSFEDTLSKYLQGTHDVVGVSSGSAALLLSLRLLNIEKGDEIIVPAFGCSALASSVLWTGARPIFVDINEDDYAIDPKSFRKAITDNTKAVIFAHHFGEPSKSILKIKEIARKLDLKLIEDATQAFGSSIFVSGVEHKAGTIGDIGCFSFSYGKPLATLGNAGAILIRKNKRSLVEQARWMCSYGARKRGLEYPVLGSNFRMDKIHASILVQQLGVFKGILGRRNMLATRYGKHLATMRNILLPRHRENDTHNWHYYVVRMPKRDDVLTTLKEKFKKRQYLIPRVPYPVLLSEMPLFNKGHTRSAYPVAEKMARESFSLPLNDKISTSDVKHICEAIKRSDT